MEELLIYEKTNNDIFEITNKKIGKLGDLVYMERFNLWSFLPIENFFYKPIHLALILKQLNILNGYKKEEK